MSKNRQGELYAAALIPYTAALVALVLRMVARRKTRMRLVWEDYLAVVAFVSGSHVNNRGHLTLRQIFGTGFTFLSVFSECPTVARLRRFADLSRDAMGPWKAHDFLELRLII